jgi:hypothetical protein
MRSSALGAALLAFGLVAGNRAEAQAMAPPPITIFQDSGSLSDGFIFVAPQSLGVPNPVQGPEILDNQGRIVWFMPSANSELVTDFRVQTYLGNPVLTFMHGITYGDTNPGDTIDYILDNTYNVVATVEAGNGLDADVHEFQLTPQNTALISIYNNLPADLSSVGGPSNGMVTEGVVQEIDVATGKVLLEWHSLTGVALTESYQAAPTSPSVLYDYFHLNSVSLDTDGNLLISSRHTWTVYKVNRTTGAIIWRLGGKKSDFTLGPGLPFAWQHDAVAVDASTIRIFDNESNGRPVLPYSRAIWVTHDDTTMTATLARSIEHPAALSAIAEGSVQDLANGNTFVEWGILGRFSEFGPTGQLLFDATEAPGYATYRGYRFPWVGNPSTSPTAVALQNSDGSIAVHAVWNGATEVASWEVLGGATSGTLATIGSAAWNGLDTVITVPGPANDIQVVAMNAAGTAIGTSATVAGPFAAVFPTQPISQSIAAGSTVVFSALDSGPAPAYQWMFNGSPLSNGTSNGTTISGATGPSLEISGATAANAGSYACVATNFGNPVTSDTATLTVSATTDAGRLIDVSCRAVVGPGDGALIAGFVVGGDGTSGSIPLLIRASGPALASVGVNGFLPDPDLTLYDAGGVLASNDDWDGNPQVASAAASVGAFPWTDDSSPDAALEQTLAAGPYTALVSGVGANSGVALAEVYDATPAGSRLPTTPRLLNISGRAQVGTGANILIAGFVIGGLTSKTVLIRASGPALAQFGVAGSLTDPMLQLSRISADGTSTLIGMDTGWGGNAQIAATAVTVGAFSWGTLATADSALLVTLAPGAYTAEISGASGDTGVSLVEAYEVP